MRLPPFPITALLVAILPLSGSAQSASAQLKSPPSSRLSLQLSYAPVVKIAAPAVVNVYVKKRVRPRRNSLLNDPFFRRFFDGNFGLPRERVQNSLGSGVIVSPGGIIVTNHHVIKGGADGEIKVVLADKREYTAHLILKDERTDLAILRIEARGQRFPFLEFKDSDGLEVGDLVLAIGNPFGVGQTVTSGIISALARTRVGISDYQFFIQTDAAINPGNSGGALVSMDGQLVGINTAIYSRGGGSIGIGFAIPANMVRLVVQSAMRGGKVQRPWFGAKLQPVSRDIAVSLGLDRRIGLLTARDIAIHAVELDPKNSQWQLSAARLEMELGGFSEAGERLARMGFQHVFAVLPPAFRAGFTAAHDGMRSSRSSD